MTLRIDYQSLSFPGAYLATDDEKLAFLDFCHRLEGARFAYACIQVVLDLNEQGLE
jgi:hypothetical protein